MVKERIAVIMGDITQLRVDSIVNAANKSLLGGGGVDGAIHQAAGSALTDECKKIGGCPTGQVRITKGYELPARYVIHAVGPIWRGGYRGECKLLAACYNESLKVALEHQVKTIAFPAISCGVYGYPPQQAAMIAIKESGNFLELHEEIEQIYFVCYEDAIFQAYQNAVETIYHD